MTGEWRVVQHRRHERVVKLRGVRKKTNRRDKIKMTEERNAGVLILWKTREKMV